MSNCWIAGNSNRFVNNTCIANSNTGGFTSDCPGKGPAPLMTVAANRIYNQAGKLDAKLCDPSNVVVGGWPGVDEVLRMGREVLQFEP